VEVATPRYRREPCVRVISERANRLGPGGPDSLYGLVMPLEFIAAASQGMSGSTRSLVESYSSGFV
jgi:hypothetical protein